MGDLVGAMRAALEGAGDPERARAQQAYMRSAMPFRGVSSPELRRTIGLRNLTDARRSSVSCEGHTRETPAKSHVCN